MIDVDTVNGGVPRDFYKENPCLIGLSYLRVSVDGSILPCCISKYEVGAADYNDWREVWHSGAYENFRQKMKRISTDHFHLSDPDWTFCQQCSHMSSNQEANKLISKNNSGS
jgi:radical SAM protein with 4Fe4S-binding SPASM domain